MKVAKGLIGSIGKVKLRRSPPQPAWRTKVKVLPTHPQHPPAAVGARAIYPRRRRKLHNILFVSLLYDPC